MDPRVIDVIENANCADDIINSPQIDLDSDLIEICQNEYRNVFVTLDALAIIFSTRQDLVDKYFFEIPIYIWEKLLSKNDDIKNIIIKNFEKFLSPHSKLWSSHFVKKLLDIEELKPRILGSFKKVLMQLSCIERIDFLEELGKDKQYLGYIQKYLNNFISFEEKDDSCDGKFFILEEEKQSEILVEFLIIATQIDGIDFDKLYEIIFKQRKLIYVAFMNFSKDESNFIDSLYECIKNASKSFSEEKNKKIQLIIDKSIEDLLKIYPRFNYRFIKIMSREMALKRQDEFINIILKKCYILDKLEDVLMYYKFAKEMNKIDWSKFSIFKTIEDIIQEKIDAYMINKMIAELQKHEKTAEQDITIIGRGAYSVCIKIGAYILKIGESREKEWIPWDKRILQPLIRMQTKNKLSNVPHLFVEIQNLGNDEWWIDKTEEEIEEILYMVWKDMMSRDVLWLDIRKENVVQLLKDNKTNFLLDAHGGGKQEMQVSKDTTTMYNVQQGTDVLKKGDYVVCDTDYIYYSWEKTNVTNSDWAKKFIERYRKEKLEEGQNLSLKAYEDDDEER